MVYICGTQLTENQLPLHESIPYTVQNVTNKIVALLAMGIKKSDTVKVYVNTNIELTRLAAGCENKVVRFSTDEELINLLKGGTAVEEAPVETEPAVPEVPEAPAEIVSATDEEVAEMQEMVDNDDIAANRDDKLAESDKVAAPEEVTSDDVEEVEVEMPAIPVTNNSICEADMLKARLHTTEQILAQSKNCLKQAEEEKNDIYDQAVNQLESVTADYEAKLADAIAAVESLKTELVKAQASADGPLSGFEVYASKSRAVLSAGIHMDNPPSNLVVVSAGSYDSTVVLAQSLALLAVSGFTGHIIDFTGDTGFRSALTNVACKVKAMQFASNGRQIDANAFADCNFDMTKDLGDVIRGRKSYVDVINTNFGSAHVASAGFFHDISLLTFHWGSFISEICSDEVSGGAPVIIILPAITSFVGEYLISYLGTVARSNVVTTCAPSSLYSTELHMSAIPQGRCGLLALNYVKSADSEARLRGNLNAKYRVKMFKANTIFSMSTPTQEEFVANIENNNRIWKEAFA